MMVVDLISLEEIRSNLDYSSDTGTFVWRLGRRKHQIAGCLKSDGYIVIRIKRRLYRAHVLAWFYKTGVWPVDDLDHINGKRSDNRFANLRTASRAENMQNSPIYRNNRSGFKGASWHPGAQKWRARLKVGTTYKHLGFFGTAEEAGAAYAEAKINLHPFQPVTRTDGLSSSAGRRPS